MIKAAGIENARHVARTLVHRFGVEAARHVFVEGFAARLGVEIVMAQLKGATAQLAVRNGESARILLSDRLTNPSIRRFTIGHELGHYVLKHPSPSVSELCDATWRGDSPAGSCDPEAEANAFSAEILMPAHVALPICEVNTADLEPVMRIAHRFGMSLQASAIRFTELTQLRCAAVLSQRGFVRWVAPSATFIGTISPGRPIDDRSAVGRYFKTGELCSRMMSVPAVAWIAASNDVAIMEHSVKCPDTGSVLTILWVP
jgi:Zn-dependent peptidase ImmA (M78 family)